MLALPTYLIPLSYHPASLNISIDNNFKLDNYLDEALS